MIHFSSIAPAIDARCEPPQENEFHLHAHGKPRYMGVAGISVAVIGDMAWSVGAKAAGVVGSDGAGGCCRADCSIGIGVMGGGVSAAADSRLTSSGGATSATGAGLGSTLGGAGVSGNAGCSTGLGEIGAGLSQVVGGRMIFSFVVVFACGAGTDSAAGGDGDSRIFRRA